MSRPETFDHIHTTGRVAITLRTRKQAFGSFLRLGRPGGSRLRSTLPATRGRGFRIINQVLRSNHVKAFQYVFCIGICYDGYGASKTHRLGSSGRYDCVARPRP
jgi:hypothetical protein